MASRTPRGLGAAGAALWRDVLAGYELGAEERPNLLRACHVLDTLAELDAIVAADGVLIRTGRGAKVAKRIHPAVVEIRAQELILARLLATLRVPAEEAEPARPARGVYQLNAVR